MCGITGLIHKNGSPIPLAIIQNMNRTLTHRGPDDEGYYVDAAIALGHRRLSIIDIAGGHQPMRSDDDRHVLVFNGEIYNFAIIKAELLALGEIFATQSDSEVLLKAYIRWGSACLNKLNGMFAFALWDKQEQKLFVARDRMGKKPLYYWMTDQYFAFASELKAICAHPNFERRLNLSAVSHYFQYEYVPSPMAIFEQVYKLPAGHCGIYQQGALSHHAYWDLPFTPDKLSASPETIQTRLVELLDQAVERRLVADVPLGVFLSGGIDSSAIVALMARHRAGKDIKTFSIGFAEKSFDESGYAQTIANLFQTDHHHQQLTSAKLLDILPTITRFLDEPFADGSIVPTTLLSQFTRQHVTVALGGDGGDELFAGYPTFQADRYAHIYQGLPGTLRRAITAVIGRLPVSHKNMSFDFVAKQFLYGALFEPILRNQVWLGSFQQEEQKNLFADSSLHENPLDLIKEKLESCQSKELGDRLLYYYQKFYLSDGILVKADRASMSAGLEVRAPFLDVDFVEYVAKIPYHYKLAGVTTGGTTKAILKQALKKILPPEIIHRKKKGFGMPIGAWLRRELKGQLCELLAPAKLKREGLFNPDFVGKLVSEHLTGKQNHRKKLFSLLMFEFWRENYFSP